MKSIKKLTLIACLVLLGALVGANGTAQAAESFQLIVNSGNPVASMDAKDVAKLFIKRVSAWDDGVSADPVDQAPDSAVREAFSETVHGRSVTAVKSYWQKQIFSGRGVPPPELSSDAAVVDFVKKNRGAIGYVSAGADVSGVKVITLK